MGGVGWGVVIWVNGKIWITLDFHYMLNHLLSRHPVTIMHCISRWSNWVTRADASSFWLFFIIEQKHFLLRHINFCLSTELFKKMNHRSVLCISFTKGSLSKHLKYINQFSDLGFSPKKWETMYVMGSQISFGQKKQHSIFF